jgi:integrase
MRQRKEVYQTREALQGYWQVRIPAPVSEPLQGSNPTQKVQNSRLDPDVLRKDALYPILDRLGIPRKKGASGFHTFRHSAASIVNEQTGNLKLAQRFLGHSTIKMTADIYTHTSAEAERGAAIALERAIYGDLFPVVPNIENRNKSAALN